MSTSLKDSILKTLNLGFERISGTNSRSQDNILALQKLSKIFDSLKRIYPYSNSALDPASLNIFINDIIINQRKNIVELGSGISTIVLSKVLQTNGINASFHSIDSDIDWVNILNQFLRDENLESYCKIHYVPITSKETNWYDETQIAKLKSEFKTIDCLLIDGPIAYQEKNKTSRKGALINFSDILSADRSIFLDDALRPGEKMVLAEWENTLNIKFQLKGNLAIHTNGNHYNFI